MGFHLPQATAAQVFNFHSPQNFQEAEEKTPLEDTGGWRVLKSGQTRFIYSIVYSASCMIWDTPTICWLELNWYCFMKENLQTTWDGAEKSGGK